MANDTLLYGQMAMFDSAERLLEAARRAREAGYRQLDAFTPFPVEGLAEVLGTRADRVRYLVLLGAVLGGLLGYWLQYYSAVIDYPLNIGGRPLHSWPSFMLVTFELTVLGGALGALLGMLALNRLPQLHHPVFNTPGFELATRGKFFLCIEAGDPLFHRDKTRAFLQSLGPAEVSEVTR